MVELALFSICSYTIKSLNEFNLREAKPNFIGAYIFPIIKPSDATKIKSGHSVMYMMKSIKPSLKEYSSINFSEINSFDFFKNQDSIFKENELLLLVDDFIGSGNTLSSTLDVLINQMKVSKERIIVMSLVIQSQAIKILDELGILYFTSQIVKKGISEYYPKEVVEEKKAIMTKIESMIPKVKNFQFGYEESEGLVTLMRTPNNTFPIFWKNHIKRGKEFTAPFPRY